MKPAKNLHGKSTTGNGFAQNGPLDAGSTPIIGANGSLDETIAMAAYFRARLRGFAPGHELDDWLQAEAECKNGSGEDTN